MKVAALFSGGKDSSLAVQRVLEKGHEVVGLVSIIPRNPESYMFHYPNIRLTELQADAAGIPLVSRDSDGVKEEELADLEEALGGLSGDVEGVVVGAIASEYQRDRVAGVCRKLGLSMEAPLWGEDPEQLWLELLAKGFEIMIVGVACDGLGKEWLGRVIDEKALQELEVLSRKHNFHIAGEGGEFETLVLDAPFFRKRLAVKDARTSWKGDSGLYIINRAALEDKQPGFLK
jgi:diphthine-ammonia ligase